MLHFDLLLVGGRVVDPHNGVDEYLDVGIAGGKVRLATGGIDLHTADRIINAYGKAVIPGVIDSHMHANRIGYRMMAKVGVITAVDFSERMDVLCKNIREYGSGMNVATVTDVRSYGNAKGTELSEKQIDGIVSKSLHHGALGVKIVGGHHPFTPDCTRRIIEVANRRKAYVAFHAGTTATGSNLHGLKEAVELAGQNSLHIAHVNSYFRGLTNDPIQESLEGLKALTGRSNIVSESYLAVINGTGGKCTKGVPDSLVTRSCLRLGKYPASEHGLERAILDGFAKVNVELGGECVLLSGSKAVRLWQRARTDAWVSFLVNVPSSAFLCATRKNQDGKFIVDAISTDGGSFPRNVTVESGLSLVKFGALTIGEFVEKTSVNPAKMFGMVSKGHLGEGADADVTVLDLERGKAVMGIAKGEVIMIDGVVVGKDGTVVTTKVGARSVEVMGMKYDLVDLEKSRFYQK
jgi:hypothetical protein